MDTQTRAFRASRTLTTTTVEAACGILDRSGEYIYSGRPYGVLQTVGASSGAWRETAGLFDLSHRTMVTLLLRGPDAIEARYGHRDIKQRSANFPVRTCPKQFVPCTTAGPRDRAKGFPVSTSDDGTS